jgi:hypothetical protein
MRLRKKINFILFFSILVCPAFGIGTSILQNETLGKFQIGIVLYIVLFSILGYTVINHKLTPIIKYLDSKQEDLRKTASINAKFIENFFIVFLIVYNTVGLFSTYASGNNSHYNAAIVLLGGLPQLFFLCISLTFTFIYYLDKEHLSWGFIKARDISITK